MQEIDAGSKRNGYFNQVEELSRSTGLKSHHFAVEKEWRGYFKDGNALLSRTKFQKVFSKVLPYTWEKRNYILSEINIGTKRLTIIATHLGAFKYNQKERMSQVKELCRILNRLETPIILMGDLNCGPTSEEFKYLVKNSGLKPLINEPTYYSFDPQNIFDQILVSCDISVKSAKVIDIKMSDHYPVFAHLKF